MKRPATFSVDKNTEKAWQRHRPPLAPVPPSSSPTRKLGGARLAVLIAVDGKERERASKWLEREGFEVLSLGGADEALEKLKRAAASVVVLGAKLSAGACCSLRGANTDVPIVAVASRLSQAESALAAGATDVVRMPCNWRVVSRRAVHMVERQEVERELQRTRRLMEEARDSAAAAQNLLRRVRVQDRLTDLPSREVFTVMLGRALKAPKRAPSSVAVFYLDLDRFSTINDSVGRATANEILRQVAARLRAALQSQELITDRAPGVVTAAVGRVCGDAFAVLLTPIGVRATAERAAVWLQQCLSKPLAVAGHEVAISASVGVALYPENGRSPEQLLQQAEAAMRSARSCGCGTSRFYDASLDRNQRELEIETELRGAIERRELTVHYQPLVKAVDDRIVGAEALLRWDSLRLGKVSPAEFIPVAEKCQLIAPIGRWVLRTACRQLRLWQEAGLPRIRMAVNLAIAQLRGGELVHEVRSALAEQALEPSLLELEISERGAMRNEPGIRDQLLSLRDLGVRIAVDDFGTGRSALAYLKWLPIDVLKIDRSYIRGMTENTKDADLASAMVALGHRLGVSVVAEGVELADQAEKLKEFACDRLQGHWYSPAVDADDFATLQRWT